MAGCSSSHQPTIGLRTRPWNLETSSAVVEFPPPYHSNPCKFNSISTELSFVSGDKVMESVESLRLSEIELLMSMFSREGEMTFSDPSELADLRTAVENQNSGSFSMTKSRITFALKLKSNDSVRFLTRTLTLEPHTACRKGLAGSWATAIACGER